MNLYTGLAYENYKYIHGPRAINAAPFNTTTTDLCITRAKNDFAALQLLLYSDEPFMVTVDDAPCFYKKGAIETFRVKVKAPVNLENKIKTNLVGLMEDDDGRLKSDKLLDESSILVEAFKVQPIWVEVELNDNTQAGNYNFIIEIYQNRLFEDEKVIKTLNFSVSVLDVCLPTSDKYSFYLDLWQHNSNISRKYEVPLWSDEHFSIMENYVASLAQLGQKAASIIASEIPWSGQNSMGNPIDPSDLYEYSIVKVSYTENGEWKYDFSALNRYVKLCEKYSMATEIEVFGLVNIWLREDFNFGKVIDDYKDGVRIRYLDESNGCYKYIHNKKDFETYLKALESNFKENGWIDKVRVVADEPGDYDKYISCLKFISSVAPSFKFKTAINHVEFMENDIPGMTDYCPYLGCITEKYDDFLKIKEHCNGVITYYVCCGPKAPNTFLCSPLIESRLIPILAHYLGIDGFLRWNYTVWPDNPNERIIYTNFPAGDTNFVYPGKNGKPVLTLRYKNLLRGIRDFEIIKMAVNRGLEEITKKQLEKIFFLDTTDDFDYKNIRYEGDKCYFCNKQLFSADIEKYEEVSTTLLKLLEQK